LLIEDATMRAILVGIVASAVIVATLAPAHADEPSPPTVRKPPIAEGAILVDAMVGPAAYTTIGSAFGVTPSLHARYAFIQAGVNATAAMGKSGNLTSAGLEVGPVLRDVGGLDVGLFVTGGNRTYHDAGKIPSTGMFGCSAVSGFDGSTQYVGGRLDVMRTVRKGPAAIYGVSLYYSRDLTSEHLVREGSTSCGLFPTSSPRTVEATMGGYELGVAFRIGISNGF
jgi:hypothetical protein